MSSAANEKLKILTRIFGLCAFLFGGILPAVCIDSEGNKLQGEVEQSNNDTDINTKSLNGVGHGKSDGGYIKGEIQQEAVEADKEYPNSGETDPDLSDKDLMIEWDHWRNRFLQAVLSGTTDALNNDQAQNFQFNPHTNIIESKYPMGTNAWFSCKILRNGQIQDLVIEHSSGFPGYDQAVRESIQSLIGSAILKFPSRSRRKSVLQAGGVERTTQVNKQYFRFGDVEHYRQSGN